MFSCRKHFARLSIFMQTKTEHVTLGANCLELALLFFRSLDKTLIVSAIFIS